MRRMLLAYSVNELGTWFGYVALALGVYDRTHSAIATAGLFVARGMLPALLSPLLVAKMERFHRRAAIALLYALEAVLTLGLAALLWRFSLPGVLVLVAIDGVTAVAATALLRAIAADLATREGMSGKARRGSEEQEVLIAEERPSPDSWAQRGPASKLPVHDGSEALDPPDAPADAEAARRQANAALNVAFMLAFAAGPALGGLIVHAVGGPLALVLDAATFGVCGVLLADLRTDFAGGDDSIARRIGTAWRYVREMRSLRTLLITEAVAIVFFASVEPIEVIYAKTTLSAGSLGLGILLGVWGCGAAVGAVVFARSGNRSLGFMLTFGTLLVGLAYLGFAAAPTLAIACVAALLGGIGNGIQWPALISAVQQLTPPSLQVRLMGAVGSMSALCPAIGFALGGMIDAVASTRVAMLVAGGVATAATAAFARIAATGLQRESPPADPGAVPARR